MAPTLALALLFLATVQAVPTWRSAETKQSAADVAKEYDYVVVGAGTAGNTVADRLSEDGKRKQVPLSSDNRLLLEQELYYWLSMVLSPKMIRSCHCITAHLTHSGITLHRCHSLM
jgi:hypothetical protein